MRYLTGEEIKCGDVIEFEGSMQVVNELVQIHEGSGYEEWSKQTGNGEGIIVTTPYGEVYLDWCLERIPEKVTFVRRKEE